MEVLSNKQIYILLKILNDKKLQEGSVSYVEFDKNFNLSDFEHIQQQISLIETEPSRQVITIEQTYMKFIGNDIHSGYKVFVSNLDIINEYANKYIEALIGECLIGFTQENNLATLLSEFYSHSNKSVSIDDYVVNDIKYMPVILFAYVNNLVDLKTISNRRYDLRKELLNKDICHDAAFNQAMDNVVDILMRMDAAELFGAFKEYMNTCLPEKAEFIQSARDFVDTFAKKDCIPKEVRKPKKVVKSIDNRYHMKPQEWKIFFCLLRKIHKEKEGGSRVKDITIAKQYFIINGVFGTKENASNTPISRFNTAYNKIMGYRDTDSENIIYPKISDTNYYMFSISKMKKLNEAIKNNNKLFEEYQKHEHFFYQIVD